MMLALTLFLLLVASLLMQEWTPHASGLLDTMLGGGGEAYLHHARVLFLPAYFFTGLLAVNFPLMLMLAFVCGMAWDAVNALVWSETSPGFGGGPVLFGFMGAIMHGARDLFLRGRWVLPILLGGACVFVLLLAEYLWINFRAGEFHFPAGLWLKIGMTTLMTTIVLPAYLLVLHRVLRGTGVLIHSDDAYPR